MKTQKRYYDFYYDNGEDAEIPPYALLYSFTNADLDGGNLPYEKMKVECMVLGDWQWLMDTFAYEWNMEGGIKKLSLQDAVKKGIKTIFTMI